MEWQSLIDQMASGSVPALSRLITLVENRETGWRGAMKRLYPAAGKAATIGITGHPGSGKSTLTGQLVRELVARGNRVGVIAIDPSSHLSGGAFLGDRIRMNESSALDGVYIRSMSSRGAMGGVHQAARDVIKILDAFGKDYILVETVGVGQDEIDITRTAQVVLLVCAPGQGDAIQYLKAGVMEIADIYVANKTDLPEAEQMLIARGIVVIPDFVANCGGVLAPDMRGTGFDGEDVRHVIEVTFAEVVAGILQAARREGQPVGEVARTLAWQNYCELNESAPISSNGIGRVSQVLRSQGLGGAWRRLARRIHHRWPHLQGAIRRAALDRYTELTLGVTLTRVGAYTRNSSKRG